MKVQSHSLFADKIVSVLVSNSFRAFQKSKKPTKNNGLEIRGIYFCFFMPLRARSLPPGWVVEKCGLLSYFCLLRWLCSAEQ